MQQQEEQERRQWEANTGLTAKLGRPREETSGNAGGSTEEDDEEIAVPPQRTLSSQELPPHPSSSSSDLLSVLRVACLTPLSDRLQFNFINLPGGYPNPSMVIPSV
jgi:hypothetical protein